MHTDTGRKTILYLVAAFLFGGVLHVLLDGVDFTDCFMQIFYCILVLFWGLIADRRIMDRRLSRILWGIVVFMEMYFILQTCKYRLFRGMGTYLWLAYYIPMLFIPLLLFFLSLYMNLQEEEKPGRGWHLTSLFGCLLIILIFTNDLHHLFNRADGSTTDISLSSAGVLFYLYWFYAAVLVLAALTIMLRKCRISVSKKQTWLLTVTICLSALWLLLYAAGLSPRIRDAYLWNTGEAFCTLRKEALLYDRF